MASAWVRLPQIRALQESEYVVSRSGETFGRWGEVFGDDTVAAMIDRLVHHADVIALKGDSYRLKDRDLGRVSAPPPNQAEQQQNQWSGGQHSTADKGSRVGRRIQQEPIGLSTSRRGGRPGMMHRNGHHSEA